MPEDHNLETPESNSDLYLALQGEVEDFALRPAFTGDLYRVSETSSVALVQHPCAMRRGVELAPKLLVCEVVDHSNQVPDDWSEGYFKRMFLPDLAGRNLAIAFDRMDVIEREALAPERRFGILSSMGVNLLVQRWLFHNSRVVVPTITISAQTAGPFDEADLVQEACEILVKSSRFETTEAAGVTDRWLGESEPGRTISRREMLANPQQRSAVRTSLRRQLKEWLRTDGLERD